MGLLELPGEIIRLIVKFLKPEDLLHLAASTRDFQDLLWDQYTCWSALQGHEFSIEYEDAVRTRNYAKGLRRLAKRRDAVQTAKPFQILQIASASHFIYSHGAICYLPDKHHLRILQLRDSLIRRPISQELVIDIPRLLDYTVFSVTGRQDTSEYTFKPIHHAHNIVSCLFARTDRRCWRNFLIVIDLERRQLISFTLVRDTRDMFVRNNRNYLYYGTRSEARDNYRERWVLQGLDLRRGAWLPARLILRDFVGSEIGSAICFEIFDDYLYCLSNQQLLEPGEIARNSFYYALRFRLGDLKSDLRINSLQKVVMWRRKADEGPVDERWNTLELSRDEQTGRIFIIETRKEFFSSVSQSLRSCYKMELVFPAPLPRLAVPSASDGSDTSDALFQDPSEGSNQDSDDAFDPGDSGDSDHVEGPDDSDNLDDSDDPSVSDHRQVWENPSKMESRELLHYGDEESSPISLTYHQTLVQSYNASCQSFVDIVNSPADLETTSKRLRLRSRPQLTGPQPRNMLYIQDLLRKNRDTEVKFWPDPTIPGSDVLCEILNPADEFDKADSAVDERFLVYSPRSYDSEREDRPLILVSFDPGLHLLGLPKFYPPTGACCDSQQAPVSARGDHSSAASYYSFGDRSSSQDSWSDSECAALAAATDHPATSPASRWIKKEIATYITRVKDGAVRGFDLSREPCRSSAH